MQYNLREVKTNKDEIAFLKMPVSIYSEDTNWIRPLDNDIKGVFNPAKNHLFDGGEAIRWILYDQNDIAIGRVAAFYNVGISSKGYCKAGGCGFFECIDCQEAANTLFDSCVNWLAERGIEAMDGSINFGERDMFWGVLIDGFHHPTYGANYNRPYYQKLFESYGFQVYFNQYSYYKEISLDFVNPTVIEKSKRLAEKSEFDFRPIRRNELPYIGEMFRDVYNKAWTGYDDIPKMSVEQSQNIAKMFKPIIDLDIVIFAFHDNVPIGFYISIPDINLAIKGLNGSLSPINILKFLYRLKIKKSCDIMLGIVFGVIPEFQGKGVESGMITALTDSLKNRKRGKYRHTELMWIGDFNPLMMRVAESHVCAKKYKHHITYRFMIDKNIEFQKAPRIRKSKT